jgi:hypothetical protein
MTLSKKNEKFGTTVAFCLVLIHTIVSIVFIFVDFSAAKNNKSLMWSGVAWIVSLLVCLIVLFLLFGLLVMESVEEKTPCPVQLSYPSMSSSNDRKDIQDAISSKFQSFKDATQRIKDAISKFPPAQKLKDIDMPPPLPYDSKRVYIVLTGYYLKKAHNLPTSGPVMSYLQNHDVVPIGYVEKGKIYSLSGKEVWPDVPDMSSILSKL